MGQENWRQRIRKENVHAPASAQFSIRSVCRALDVPKKPCQVHPDGAPETNEEMIEAVRSFGRSHAPNEQFFWPETAQHDVGWLIQEKSQIPMAQRNTILAPSKLGFGWRRGSADRRQECCLSVLPPQPATPSTGHKSQLEAPQGFADCPAGPSDAEKALPWFPGIGQLRRQRRMQRNWLREVQAKCPGAEILSLEIPKTKRRSSQRRPSTVPVPPLDTVERAEVRPLSAVPGISAGLRVVKNEVLEDKWRRETPIQLQKPSTADHEVIASRSVTCREFLRHGPRSQWESQKPVSAMSSFAHGYTMLWGVNFFSTRGSQRR